MSPNSTSVKDVRTSVRVAASLPMEDDTLSTLNKRSRASVLFFDAAALFSRTFSDVHGLWTSMEFQWLNLGALANRICNVCGSTQHGNTWLGEEASLNEKRKSWTYAIAPPTSWWSIKSQSKQTVNWTGRSAETLTKSTLDWTIWNGKTIKQEHLYKHYKIPRKLLIRSNSRQDGKRERQQQNENISLIEARVFTGTLVHLSELVFKWVEVLLCSFNIVALYPIRTRVSIQQLAKQVVNRIFVSSDYSFWAKAVEALHNQRRRCNIGRNQVDELFHRPTKILAEFHLHEVATHFLRSNPKSCLLQIVISIDRCKIRIEMKHVRFSFSN